MRFVCVFRVLVTLVLCARVSRMCVPAPPGVFLVPVTFCRFVCVIHVPACPVCACVSRHPPESFYRYSSVP